MNVYNSDMCFSARMSVIKQNEKDKYDIEAFTRYHIKERKKLEAKLRAEDIKKNYVFFNTSISELQNNIKY